MTARSSIEWTEVTWNPCTGCTKVSPGCKHCYAERMAKRLQAMGNHRYSKGFQPAMHGDLLRLPLRWKRPRVIFVNSMSDLFHPEVPLSFIQEVFDVMNQADWHIYQILTKRSQRLRECDGRLEWNKHIWAGVSVETADYAYRIERLRQTGAHVKFISFEPLLGPMPGLDLTGIDWVIAGGESGPGARPMAAEWVKGIRDRCVSASAPFFFKQWGGVNKKKNGRELDGRTWDETPDAVAEQPALIFADD